MWFILRANPVSTTRVTCTMMKPTKPTSIRKWIDRAPCLPPNIRVYRGKRFTRAGDIAKPVRMEVGAIMKMVAKYKLLQRVVPVKTVRLGRQLKIRVVDESVPGLNEHRPRSRHQALPLFAREQSAHKEYAGQDEPIDVDEMPAPSEPNGVGVSRQRKYWRDVAVVVLRGPNAIFRNP